MKKTPRLPGEEGWTALRIINFPILLALIASGELQESLSHSAFSQHLQRMLAEVDSAEFGLPGAAGPFR